MANIAIGGRKKWGIDMRQRNPTFSTFCSHSFGCSVVTVPSTLCSISASVAKWGNFYVSARSQSSNFIVAIRPTTEISTGTAFGIDGVMSIVSTSSRFVGNFTFPLLGDTYLGQRTVWMGSSSGFTSST